MAIIIIFGLGISQPRQGENWLDGSIEGTIDGTFKATTNDAEVQTKTVILLVLTTVGALTLLNGTSEPNTKDKEKQIVLYMKHNHSVLKRDFSLATGDTIRDIGYQLKFDESEANLFANNIEGSIEQQRILQSLSDEITVKDARSFAYNLTTLVRDSIEPHRYADLLQYALLTSKTPASK